MPKFNVTMYEQRFASIIIEARTGREAKDIALNTRGDLFDFNSDEPLYQVGEAEYIPPDEDADYKNGESSDAEV